MALDFYHTLIERKQNQRLALKQVEGGDEHRKASDGEIKQKKEDVRTWTQKLYWRCSSFDGADVKKKLGDYNSKHLWVKVKLC